MSSHEETDFGMVEDNPQELQAELVEWEAVAPRCYALRLRVWDDDPDTRVASQAQTAEAISKPRGDNNG